MILQNHFLDQDKSFQKLLNLELGSIYLLHCTLIWYDLYVMSTLDISKNPPKVFYAFTHYL